MKSIAEILESQRVKVKTLSTGVTTYIRPNGHVIVTNEKMMNTFRKPL